MRRFLVVAAIALLPAGLLLPLAAALAQQANEGEMETINEIARCLAQGVPADWVSAYMVVELEKPGDSTGRVSYLVLRKGAEEQPEAFTPCDTAQPPRLLVTLRDRQAPERRGWTTARLILERDGSFSLNYDFPK